MDKEELKRKLHKLTIQELQDLYDRSTEAEKQFLHENRHLWFVD